MLRQLRERPKKRPRKNNPRHSRVPEITCRQHHIQIFNNSFENSPHNPTQVHIAQSDVPDRSFDIDVIPFTVESRFDGGVLSGLPVYGIGHRNDFRPDFRLWGTPSDAFDPFDKGLHEERQHVTAVEGGRDDEFAARVTDSTSAKVGPDVAGRWHG